MIILPVWMNVPGDWAITMEPLPAAANKSERTKTDFIAHLTRLAHGNRHLIHRPMRANNEGKWELIAGA
jgi:hypothetical protein